MPPAYKFTREEVVDAALALTRQSGLEAVTARALAAALGASSKPIFSLFENMDALRAAVIGAANDRYHAYLRAGLESDVYPPYKGCGMAYIRFAQEEPALFRLLFMRDRTGEDAREDPFLSELISVLQGRLGLSREDAYIFHIEMWIYVHGIAAMAATAYLQLDQDTVSRLVSDVYEGLRMKYAPGEA